MKNTAEEKNVEITLFRDGEKYKRDVFVCVNGKRYLIKRGETVNVPQYIAEVLERSVKQQREAEYFRLEGWKNSRIKQEDKK